MERSGWGDEETAACFVFHCNNRTQRECLAQCVFGAPANHAKILETISANTQIFLYNINTRELHGVFGSLGKPNVPAFNGKYPAQLQVRLVSSCKHSKHMGKVIAFGLHDEPPFVWPTPAPAQGAISLTPAQLFAAASAANPVPVAQLEAPADVQLTTSSDDVQLLDLSDEVKSSVANSMQFEPCFELHSFLRSLSLERYISRFDQAEVVYSCLKTLSEQDLKQELGLPFGPARTIVNTLRDRDAEASSAASDLSSSLRLLSDSDS